MEKRILINCPCESHKIKRENSVCKEIKAMPKILFVATPESVGEFWIQCPDNYCRRYNKEKSGGKYNSWYKIILNGFGGCSVEAIPRHEFDLQKVPFVVLED